MAIKNFVLAVLNLRYTLAIQMEVLCRQLDEFGIAERTLLKDTVMFLIHGTG